MQVRPGPLSGNWQPQVAIAAQAGRSQDLARSFYRSCPETVVTIQGSHYRLRTQQDRFYRSCPETVLPSRPHEGTCDGTLPSMRWPWSARPVPDNPEPPKGIIVCSRGRAIPCTPLRDPDLDERG